jgi:hypothetical protein
MAETCWLGRVHAEIKLLFFYEIHSRSVRPRVICSSKSACYLCNLFIHIHGEFFTPRTHGRLYEKWILPDWLQEIPVDRRQNLSSVVSQMNKFLEEKIWTESMEKRKPYLQPDESVLQAPAYWPSTSEKSTVSSSSTATLRQANNSSGSTEPALGNVATPVLKQQLSNRISVIEEQDTSSDTSSSPHLTQTPYQALTRGELLWKQLNDTEGPLAFTTKSVHTIVCPPTRTSANNWVQLKWLHPNEQLNVSSTVVHLKDLPLGVDVTLTEVEMLYLCHAKDIISITCSPYGPE